MSSGSSASNLGYGNIAPFSNVDGKYVNVDNSNYSGNFTSKIIPGTPPGPLPGLSGVKNNVDAANSSKMNGGAKMLKKKIKNITKHYKRMKAGSRKIKSLKKKILRHRFASKSRSRQFAGSRRHRRRTHRRHKQRGGYAQYQNNAPITPTYQVAGINLPSSQLGLANPPPITKLSNCVNCVDNYNHYTNKGFPSKGN
jgi:hypothetical protein